MQIFAKRSFTMQFAFFLISKFYFGSSSKVCLKKSSKVMLKLDLDYCKLFKIRLRHYFLHLSSARDSTILDLLDSISHGVSVIKKAFKIIDFKEPLCKGNASNDVWFEFDFWNLILFDLNNVFQHLKIFELRNLSLTSNFGKLLCFICFWDKINKIFKLLLLKNARKPEYRQVFCSKVRQNFQIFEIIWCLNLTYQNLIWIWEKSFEAFLIPHY